MTVAPVMSSSSSTATVVSLGSPENTWLGHWARIRLRMVSRRTASVKVEENRLNPDDKDVRTLGHTPEIAHIRKNHHISKTPSQQPKTQAANLSCQFKNTTKEKPHCSPSRKAHPQTIWLDFRVGMGLVGYHRVFRMLEVPASDTGSEGLASCFEISISSFLLKVCSGWYLN